MDTAKLNSFLQNLQPPVPQDELDKVESPFELPDPEQMVRDGADPQFAFYSAIHSQLLSMAVILEQSGIVDEYREAVESGIDLYMPGFPPMSPVTDSYFYLWALCDLTFGEERDNIGQVVLQILEETGAPAEVLATGRNVVGSRMGIYETVGDDGDLLVVRELVTGRELLVDAPTGFLGAEGDLRFVRLAPPIDARTEYFTELTTPYILEGRSADEWTAYLESVMPERVTTADGIESTDVADRLAAVFKDDLGTMPWLDYVFYRYRGFEPEVIFLTGIPNVPESLPHLEPHSLTVQPHARHVTGGPDSDSDAKNRSRGKGNKQPLAAQAPVNLITISLTEAQSQAAADVMPQLRDAVRPQSKGRRNVQLPEAEWHELSQRVSTQLTIDGGRGRTRLRNLRAAIVDALPLWTGGQTRSRRRCTSSASTCGTRSRPSGDASKYQTARWTISTRPFKSRWAGTTRICTSSRSMASDLAGRPRSAGMRISTHKTQPTPG